MNRIITTSFVVLLSLFALALPAFAQEATPAAETQTAPAAPAAPSLPPQVPVSQNLLAFFNDVPEATMTALRTASGLADEGKWASAFKAMQDFDPTNADPFALAMKTEIALKGNAQTYMHMVFAFVDLEPGKDLNMVRMVGAENAEPVDFDPGTLSAAIEAAGVTLPPVLYKVLGDYYFEVLTNYSGQWVEDDQAVSLKILENYERAIAGEAYDDQTLFRQGEVLLKSGNNAAAGTVLGKYLALNPEDAQARFNFAKSLVADGKTEEAYTEINTLIASNVEAQLKNDIYMFAIQTSVGAQDGERTESYLTAMQNENPDDSVPGLIRHLLSVRKGEEEAAAIQADSLLTKSQGDPNVVRSLVSSWLSEEKPEPALAFLERGLVRHAESPQVLGTLFFYKSLLQAELAQAPEDFAAALATMDSAEENFKKVLPPDSQVFATITDLRGKMKQSMEGPAPGEAQSGEAGAAEAQAESATPAVTEPAAAATTGTETDTTSSASETGETAPAEATPAAPTTP